MINIFKNVPANFFSVLTSDLRHEYAHCLALIFEELENSYEYTLNREDVVKIIENYLIDHKPQSDSKPQSYRDKASSYIRLFKDRGWIEEDFGSNYQVLLSFTEAAIEFMNYMQNLEKGSELEYSSQIFSIHNSLKAFDPSKGELIIESAYTETLEFMNNLKKLNTTMKKYIRKLLDENIKNDLRGLLDLLSVDYQVKVVDVAYHHLLTRDHPSQYAPFIISKVNQILHDDIALNQMARNMHQSEENMEISKKKLRLKLHHIHDSFQNITSLLNEITHKNKRFISSAIGLINFLLNDSTDITGRINSVIKDLEQTKDLALDSLLLDVAVLNEHSLATPRRKVIKQESYIEKSVEIEESSHDLIQSIIEMNRYSIAIINQVILESLGELKSMNASRLGLKDRSTILLIYIYGLNQSEDSVYDVSLLDTTFYHSGMHIYDFIIRRISK